MRRSSLAVALVSLGVLVLGGHLLIRRLRHEPPPPPAGDPPSPPGARPRPATTRPSAFGQVPPAAARGARRAAGGAVVSELAELRGSVVLPADTPAHQRAKLNVAADDGRTAFAAKVDPQGRFSIRLPPRTYSLTASAGTLTGAVDDVRAVAGETIEGITVRLHPEAVIDGKVHTRGPATDSDPHITAVRTGTETDSGEVSVEDDGRFTVSGLVAGLHYDLQVELQGFRPATVRAIAAPAHAVEVTLEPLPRLRGAVGLSEDGTCPVEEILVRAGDHEDGGSIDERCQFDLDELPPGRAAEVVAWGPGLHLEARVAIPERGDPEPLCLNPPCSDKPLQDRATLVVELADAGERDGLLVSVAYEANGARGCGSNGNSCDLDDLPAGVPIGIEVTSARCEPTELKMTLRPGHNPVVVPCRRMREVQGVVRVAAGGRPPAPPDLLLRCGEQSSSRTGGRFIFSLRCPTTARELEWRPENEPAWRRVALGAGPGPAFVEIPIP